MRQTKIIATVGPASQSPHVLDALIAAGADVFRLNFSHGNHQSHGAIYRDVRAAAQRAGRVIAIMQDLSGPKIRTGPLEGGHPLQLTAGDELRIGAGENPGRSGQPAARRRAMVRDADPRSSCRGGRPSE